MSNKLKSLKYSQGFTIIEVIIVLVIAAIIMLIVFLVVPQLQRSSRNSRAQSIARQVLAAGEQYAANNNGAYPTCAAGVAGSCTNVTNITGSLKNGNNIDYAYVTTAPTTDGQIAIVNNGACNASGPSGAPTLTGGTKYTVVVPQETATGIGTYCLSN